MCRQKHLGQGLWGICPHCGLIGDKFVYGFQFFGDEPVKRIDPKHSAHQLRNQSIQGVFLNDMGVFVFKNFLPGPLSEVQTAFPKQSIPK